MADRFEDLRAYVTVVSCGGINAAAAELGIAKSAVSRRIAELEARLGTVLIERSKHHFEVTATGRGYFERAKQLLASLEALDADPGSVAIMGSVSVAASAAVARHVLAPGIAAFLRDRPGVTVSMVEADEPADIAVTSGREGAGRRLRDARSVLCASEAYLEAEGQPTTGSDLPNHRGVMLEHQARRWRMAGGATRTPRTALVALDEDVALAMVTAGAGIAQLPDFVVAEAIAAGVVRTLLDGEAPPVSSLTAVATAGDHPLSNALMDDLVRGAGSRR